MNNSAKYNTEHATSDPTNNHLIKLITSCFADPFLIVIAHFITYNEEQGQVVSWDETYTMDMITEWDDNSIEEDEEQEMTRLESVKLTIKVVLDKPAKQNQ